MTGEMHNPAIRDGLIEDETFDELEFYANDLFAFPSSARQQICFWITSKPTKTSTQVKCRTFQLHVYLVITLLKSGSILVLFLKERKTSSCRCSRTFVVFLTKMVKLWSGG